MEIPTSLRSALDALAEGLPQTPLARDAQALSERYRNQSANGARLVQNDAEATAYALSRMPATYGAVFSALRWTAEHTGAEFQTLLDAGAGTGAACWAALSALSGIREITCIEREGSMRRIGQRLMEAGPDALRRARWLSFDLTAGTLPHRADIVMASYVLSEMAEGDRAKAADALWDAADKLLLVVEPGTPAGFKKLAALRERLISRGAHLATPCPHEGPCPVPPGDWCHFSCRIPRSRVHRALKGGDAPYEDEKFCYMAFSRTPCQRPVSRVLRHPQTEPGRVTLTLCTPEGIQKCAVMKREGERFKRARKTDWGDGTKI